MKINFHIEGHMSYPSIAVVPFGKGDLTEEALGVWQLLENGVAVHSHKEIVRFWPEPNETSKWVMWVHVHAIFHGDKYYSFDSYGRLNAQIQDPIPPDSDVDWEIQVEDHQQSVFKNTAAHRSMLHLVREEDYSLNLISDHGGWKHADSDETKFEELNNDFLRITRYEGWLKKSDGQDSIFRYCTRITRYRHSLIKIDNRVTFGGKMLGKKLKHISFIINHQTAVPIDTTSGVDGARYHFVLRNLTDHVAVHQRRIDHCEVEGPQNFHNLKKSDGYISKGNITLLSRDFWQKFPQAFECDHNTITYRQWYGKCAVFDEIQENNLKERLTDQNLHKLYHWHHGPFLENDIPKTNNQDNPEWADRYYLPFLEQKFDSNGNPVKNREGDNVFRDKEDGDPAEEFIEYTDFADMQGISIHDDIGVYLGPAEQPALAKIWDKNPVGYCDSDYIELTAVSDFRHKGNDFERVEKFLEESILSYTDPDRFEDYGRFLYGESHRNIFPHFKRPSRHRLGLASYYCAGETYWRMRLRGGSDEILRLARRNTERYRSIIQVSYDELMNQEYPNHPETYWHNPGGFWYRGLWWGNNDRQPEAIPHNPPWEQQFVAGHGAWNTRVLRIPDPDSLLWSWILDGNRYHKEGYELWYKKSKNEIAGSANAGAARNFNKMLVYGISAYKYFLSHPNLREDNTELKNNLIITGKSLLRWTLVEATGPLFHPEWIRTYVEFLVKYDDSSDRLTNIQDVLSFCINNYDSNFHDGQKTLDMATLMIDIFLENYIDYYPRGAIQRHQIKIEGQLDWISRIIEKIVNAPQTIWDKFGIGDGELGDAFLKLQWGAFLKRIRNVGFTDDQLLEYDFHGHYPCSSNSGGRGTTLPSKAHLACGNEYLIAKPIAGRLELQFKFSPKAMNSKGGFSYAEIWVVSPSKSTPHPESQIKASKFISVFLNRNITGATYPSGVTCQPNPAHPQIHTCTLQDLQAQHSFDSFSEPHCLLGFKYNWERSDPFMTENGTEDYTVQDYLETSETGVFRIFINGKSIYPGLTQNNLYETMVLNPYPYDVTEGSSDSGDYMFTDSMFYLKNNNHHPVTVTFWASVLVEPKVSDPAISYGSFARVKRMDLTSPTTTLESYDLMYAGTGYGDLNSGRSFVVEAGSIILLKTILIYNLSLVRAKLNGKLLCGRSLNDVNAFVSDDPMFINPATD